MDDYAGRVLADRYRLPLPPFDGYELVETRAFDTYSGQEVLVRQVPLPEIVDAEVLDADGLAPAGGRGTGRAAGRAVRRSTDPAVRRAIEAAQAAAQVPDHPRLDQVFDVFAEAGSLWIVSELVPARPLAALLAERPLNPYRAAEIGSDVLTALRVLHAHGWTHRNITVRTVLICDDGRVVLTGLAAGAAEEALCGYVTAPLPDDDEDQADGDAGGQGGPAEYGEYDAYGTYADTDDVDDPDHPDAPEYVDDPDDSYGAEPAPARPESQEIVPRPAAPAVPFSATQPSAELGPAPLDPVRPGTVPPGAASAAQLRAARAGAIAAYRAGARAAARVNEDKYRKGDGAEDDPAGDDTALLPVQRPASGGSVLPGAWGSTSDDPYAEDDRYAPDPYADDDPYASDDPYAGRDGRDGRDDRDVRDGRDGRGDDEDGDGRPPGRRVHLAGTWGDGPGSGRPVPAGGSGEDALRADSRRPGSTPVPPGPEPLPVGSGSGGWDEVVAAGRGTPPYRGPATPRAAERARQARIAVVGAVTERWAPEQAGPVHENWQLAPPIGPATDLWALGALLYRAVQGHAPYPEENAAELVQMVCGEPPAFAEESGALRPVVESLLRQDPSERPDVEELSGWLRSLVRAAPEPEAGTDVVPLPSADETRLPIVRRRGELVRKRRGRGGSAHGRHRQGKQKQRQEKQRQEEPRHEEFEQEGGLLPEQPYEIPEPRDSRPPRPPRPPRAPREPKGPRVLREPARPGEGRGPRSLGRLLLVLILLGMAAAVAYALVFMSEDEPGAGAVKTPSGSATPAGPGAGTPGTSGDASAGPGSQQPQTSRSAVALAPGYVLRKDVEGFEVGVVKNWQRSPANADRQIRYGSDGFSLLIVPGRDTVKANGADPLAYQRDKEPELQPFRDSSWSSSAGLRRVDVGRQAMAEGQFTWQENGGREVYVRNLAMVVDGRYHIIQVIGPHDQRDKVTAIYEQAIASYRVGS
ncbi:protein kinase [Streptomyces sp. BE147]|uniref:protein kinase n=1 Tax=Streptomyces sp. BE147 TaxID=3002524 RepID=UPI002E78F0C0|nr:protein kinase [Streptomyces sp. BE147]MEE1741976.1 protein kinase [Streptomyces sp. BE147]